MIAALFVAARGVYFGLPEVDPWDEARDARAYRGPYAVVAHPPCSSWCQLASVNEKRWGHKIGDDGGCFESALASVRRWGGVLEHPAFSLAWPRFGLPEPTSRGWQKTLDGAWVGECRQLAYGHPANKLTWLYVVSPVAPPPLVETLRTPEAQCGHMAGANNRRVLGKKESKATPVEFRNLLLSIARAAGESLQSAKDAGDSPAGEPSE